MADNPADPHGGVTFDHLLGGKVSYQQPRDGLRATIDPILLAAAIPARPGELVLEGGTGAGAALLCVAARVPGVVGLGLDLDAGLVRLARRNAIENGCHGLMFTVADLAASPAGGGFDHAFANPPYHAADGTRSGSAAREAAKRSAPGLLPVWISALASTLRHRGTLTLILPPRLLEPALAAMRACLAPADFVLPIWPKQGRPAGLMLLRGRKGGRAPLVLLPGLVLHSDSGEFSAEADAILRGGSALHLSST